MHYRLILVSAFSTLSIAAPLRSTGTDPKLPPQHIGVPVPQVSTIPITIPRQQRSVKADHQTSQPIVSTLPLGPGPEISRNPLFVHGQQEKRHQARDEAQDKAATKFAQAVAAALAN